ncbi:MAG: hypothetical protein QM426_05230 [Euryarchaeota archaeon]|nr:hypothetical protein [Euryarchaeota archaeon]
MNRKMSRKNTFAAAVFFIALFLLGGLTPASANEDDWDNLTVTLGPENSIVSKDGYSLEALEFDGYGMVLVQLLKNDIVLEDAVLENNSSSWCYLDGKNVRLKAYNVTDQRSLPIFGSLFSPKAEIIFETKRNVEDNIILELDLEEDKDKYLLGEEVIVLMELRNTGLVKAEKINLELDSDGLLVREGCPENIVLDKGSKKSCELRFRFPENIKETYFVKVNVNWEDLSGEHSISKTVEINVDEPLKIYKIAGSEGFSGSPVYVTLSVKNTQDREVKVRLFDLLPATFSAVSDTSSFNNTSFGSEGLNSNSSSCLSWDFVLAPKEKKSFSYCIKSEQLGAHRVPKAHAYSNLCGQPYTKISDSKNIITIYKNISYIPYSKKALTEVNLKSGADLRAYLDSNGYALLDIWVTNDALDASIFIPEGTRLLDSKKEPLKTIIITKADQPPLPGALYLVGKHYYGLEPEGAEVNPYVNLSMGLDSSIRGNFPSIYSYNEDTSIWTHINSTSYENRISARITNFSVYAALAQPPAGVKLHVNLVPP